jgi:hypothetical protein
MSTRAPSRGRRAYGLTVDFAQPSCVKGPTSPTCIAPQLALQNCQGVRERKPRPDGRVVLTRLVGFVPAMRTRLLLGLAGLAGVVLIGLLAWASRTSDLREALLADARAAYAAPSRPPHVERPSPGSFGAQILPTLADLQKGAHEYRKRPQETQDACDDVRKGNRPVSELPAVCLADLRNYREAVNAALGATHATRLDIPPALDSLRAESWAPDAVAGGWLGAQHAAKLAALDIRLRLFGEGGPLESPESIVDECLDGLALGRDASLSQGLIGDMISVAIGNLLFPSCASALDAAPADQKRRAAHALLSIRDETKSFANVMRDEAVFSDLAFAGATLTAAELQEFPPEAVAFIRVHPVKLEGLMKAVPAIAWRRFSRMQQRWRLAMALPRPARTQALTAIPDLDARGWNPISRGPEPSMGSSYRRHLRSQQRLELLVAVTVADAFRSASGRWPTAGEIEAEVRGADAGEFLLSLKGENLELGLPDDGNGAVAFTVTPDHDRG